jgi:hypothetical protein
LRVPATLPNRERLACVTFRNHTRAIDEKEIRQRVKEILLKQSLGDDLTSQEETILAFAYYVAGEQAVRIWIGSEPEIGQ